MARIRTIKPDLFLSPNLARVSLEARLTFIGVITQADDSGRLVDAPRMLAGALFPHDDDISPAQVDEWLNELAEVGCLRRYQADGGKYLCIPSWGSHQKISHPTESRLPSDSGTVPETLRPEREVEREREKEFTTRGVAERDSGRPEPYEDSFTRCWDAYPRKTARKAALRAYIARRREGVADADLLAAATHYSKACEGQDPKYFMHGSTFFGPDERWRDYLDPGSAKPAASTPVRPMPFGEAQLERQGAAFRARLVRS